jgi:hypothetical protein
VQAEGAAGQAENAAKQAESRRGNERQFFVFTVVTIIFVSISTVDTHHVGDCFVALYIANIEM